MAGNIDQDAISWTRRNHIGSRRHEAVLENPDAVMFDVTHAFTF
jgi:hypothetical protein